MSRPGRLFWLALLAGAAGIPLVLWLVLQPYPPPPPLDAPADQAGPSLDIDAAIDAPIDTPRSHPHVPPDGDFPHGIDSPICPTLSPVVTFTESAPGKPGYTSPPVYGSPACLQALSIQIDSYSASYVGDNDEGGTFVAWADASLRTKSACEESWIRADLYRQSADKWTLVRSKVSHGTWTDAGFCQPPRVGWRNADDDPDPWIAGSRYRIVSTARTNPNGATRTLRVYSEEDREVIK